MKRQWRPDEFNRVYEQSICRDEMQFGGSAYHRRYRSRYKECIRRVAEIAPDHAADVLDVGGGQLALLCKELWKDRGFVADLPGPHLSYMAEHGLRTIQWNLCASDLQFDGKFDVVFFSDVIEHLPIPGYIALERLRKVLRPGGVLICTTPNLYRLRNVVFLALGKPIFDNFQYPESDTALGHVLEYSRDHLDWQFKRAGFKQCNVEYFQAHHIPTNPLHRPIAILGYPLHLLPRWRDYLIATAFVPA